MKRTILAAVALLLFSMISAAQDGPLVDVYICETGSGCGHAVTSQEFDRNTWETLLGYPPPRPDSSIVCLGSGACGWTSEPIESVDLREGGDGIVEPIETIPAAYLPEPDSAVPPAEPADPSLVFDDPSLDSRDFWVLICNGDRCRVARSKITKGDAILLIGEEPPPGDFFVRCDDNGCRWQLWGGTILPNDGLWQIDQRNPVANNCPEDATNPLSSITVQMSGQKTWSNPPQPGDIFVADGGGFEQVIPTIPYPNGYNLRLITGSGTFSATAIYEWAVLSETSIVGTVVIDVPSIFGGRCVVYVPFQMTYQG